mgnify:FL=1
MTIKLAMLKSGEDVIADIQEMTVPDSDGKDKLVGYFFRFPCRVKLFGDVSESSGNNALKLQLIPWNPLSEDEYIPVVADWVIGIVEPIQKLKETYLKGFEKYEKSKTISADEQPDSTDTD